VCSHSQSLLKTLAFRFREGGGLFWGDFVCSHYILLFKRLAFGLWGIFRVWGGIFGVFGEIGRWGGILEGILCVATRNLLLKRLAFRGFGRGVDILGGFVCSHCQSFA
jgi:hypothetical protein